MKSSERQRILKEIRDSQPQEQKEEAIKKTKGCIDILKIAQSDLKKLKFFSTEKDLELIQKIRTDFETVVTDLEKIDDELLDPLFEEAREEYELEIDQEDPDNCPLCGYPLYFLDGDRMYEADHTECYIN
jgi:hypothetical protein